MQQLTLHIGRHKTGTTAIQRFLTGNRETLQSRGWHVPRAGLDGPGHHALARPLTPQEQQPGTPPAAIPALEALHSEAAELAPGQRLAVSSEAFQNCEPGVVREAFERFDTQVVVYVRNQVDYVASAYAQRVHATLYDGDIERYYRECYAADYEQFLQQWQRAFPRDFLVRRYGREYLEQGDIVVDFARRALRLEDLDGLETGGDSDANQSLNARVLQFKLRLNREGGLDDSLRHALYQALPRLNALFPGPPVRLPEKLRNRVIWEHYDSDSAVARRYFDERELFDYSGSEAGEPPLLGDADYAAMREALEQDMQRFLEMKRAERARSAQGG